MIRRPDICGASRSLLIAALLVPLIAPPVGACSPAENWPLELDPAFAGDTTPPGEITARAELREDDSVGCGGDTCGDLSSIRITVAALDDQAPANRIGYRLRVVGGVPPTNIPTEDIQPAYGSEIILYIGDRRGFSFGLEVAPVDLNGNVGAPVTITVRG